MDSVGGSGIRSIGVAIGIEPNPEQLGGRGSAKVTTSLRFALGGELVVTGPKGRHFYDPFSNYKATLLKADGKDKRRRPAKEFSSQAFGGKPASSKKLPKR